MNWIRWFLVLACIGLSVWGCNDKPAPSHQDHPIKIGVIYPLSGTYAATGEDLKAGVELAAEIINQSVQSSLPLSETRGFPGHSHAPLELLYRNSQNDPTRAADAVSELFLKGAVAVIGCYSSTITAAASEQAEMLKIPFLNATSTSPILTQRGFKWFFRTTPDDDMFAENFFAFFDELKQQKHPGVSDRISLVYENRLFGTNVSQAERRQARKRGYTVSGDIPYDADASQFDDELKQIKSSMPGIILQTSYCRDAVMMIRGYKAANINPVAILGMNAGFISPDFIGKLGNDAEYIFSREVWASDLGEKKALIGRINERFREKYRRDMTGNSARAFTGLLVLADAVNRAESLSPESIRAALLKTRMGADECIMPWDGIEFNPENGQNTLGKGIIVQVIKGKYRTVWPRSFSLTPFVWPTPRWSEREKIQ